MIGIYNDIGIYNGSGGKQTTYSGDIVNFYNGGALTLQSVSANIKAQQSFNGYDYPWAAGAGKNKFNVVNVINAFINTSTSSLNNNTGARTGYILCSANTTYTVSKQAGKRFAVGETSVTPAGGVSVSNIVSGNTSSSLTITTSSSAVYLVAFVYLSSQDTTITADEMLATVQIEEGSQATSYAPYENICPITGFTGANIYVSPTTSIGDATTYSVSWSDSVGTVYGGTLDVVSGVLKACPYYSSYSGQTLTGEWISDRDKYVSGTTPTTGAQVVNIGGSLTSYQLTAQQVSILTGSNYIWNTVGDSIVTVVDPYMYFKRPSDFVIQREDIYAGEYTTCTGATKADRVGWKYSDTTLVFDELTQDELNGLMSINGAVSFVFDDSDGPHSENVICTGIMKTPTRFTLPTGQAIWKDCEVGLRFIDAHN